MARFGYKLMTEEHGPKDLVDNALKAEDAGLQGGERAIELPALQPSMCRTFRGPLDPLREVAPAAARDQHVQPRMHDLAERGMRHASPARERLWGKDVRQEVLCQVAQALESARQKPLLRECRG